jgi:cysteinyl-tRNA synthetase, unknown class
MVTPARLATEGDTPHHQRGIEASGPFLAFRGRADQMGKLEDVAARYRIIAVDAEPSAEKFSGQDVTVLRGGGRNVVLGLLNVGTCDRRSKYWASAPDDFLPCAANLRGQIGPRSDRPQEVWMSPEDEEYQRLIIEYVAPRIAQTGVDGFLLDGLDLLDHGSDDDEAACDGDCITAGLNMLTDLRKAFPDLILVTQASSQSIARASLGKVRVEQLLDGVVGEGVYTPSYHAEREADLLAWKQMGLTINGRPFAVISQDYVDSCDDSARAQTIYQASHSHGFSPAIALSPLSRPRVCAWSFSQ